LERREYERLAAVEDRMWWFRGLHANLLAALDRRAIPQERACALAMLDAGCGTGGFLARLGARADGGTALGLELDEGACRLARAKSRCAVAVGSVNALPFADRSLDIVFCADVLSHRGVEPGAALAGFRRCLRPGGVLVLNLPAYRWLYSGHDAAVDNVRRFGRREVLSLLAASGFAGARADYWNSILFPVMLMRRKLAFDRGGASDVTLLPAPVERVFAACLAVESKLAAAGVRLPFGGSILATAVRP
jgi:SAM-dependent methyltransferase